MNIKKLNEPLDFFYKNTICLSDFMDNQDSPLTIKTRQRQVAYVYNIMSELGSHAFCRVAYDIHNDSNIFIVKEDNNGQTYLLSDNNLDAYSNI